MKILEITAPAPKLDMSNPVSFIRSMQKQLGMDDVETTSTDKGIDADYSLPSQKSNIGLNPEKKGGIGIDPDKSSDTGLKVKPVDGQVTSQFGHRKAPVPGATTNHPGVDLAAQTGTPVRSPISGKVVYASMDNNACGGTIAVSNGKEKHRFCHCSKISVSVGDEVKKGSVVGLTGGGRNDPGRGISTGPHLHWEKYVAGNVVDPMANVG